MLVCPKILLSATGKTEGVVLASAGIKAKAIQTLRERFQSGGLKTAKKFIKKTFGGAGPMERILKRELGKLKGRR